MNPRHGSAPSPNLKGKRASRSGLGTSLLGPFLFATPLARLAPFKREAPVTGGADRGFGFLWGEPVMGRETHHLHVAYTRCVSF